MERTGRKLASSRPLSLLSSRFSWPTTLSLPSQKPIMHIATTFCLSFLSLRWLWYYRAMHERQMTALTPRPVVNVSRSYNVDLNSYDHLLAQKLVVEVVDLMCFGVVGWSASFALISRWDRIFRLWFGRNVSMSTHHTTWVFPLKGNQYIITLFPIPSLEYECVYILMT